MTRQSARRNFKESIIKKEETGTVCEIIKEKAEEKLENESKPETDSTPDLDDRHEVEDVVEQMQDDLLEAEEMIKLMNHKQKDWSNRGGNMGSRAKNYL